MQEYIEEHFETPQNLKDLSTSKFHFLRNRRYLRPSRQAVHRVEKIYNVYNKWGVIP